MEYAYATGLLNETGAEINEENLKAVLEAAGTPVQESRVKAVVAALEDIEIADGTAGEVELQDETRASPQPDTQQSGPETAGEG